MIEPIKMKAGDERVLVNGRTLRTDFRIISEANYSLLIKMLNTSYDLLGNPGTNISGSTDLACEKWRDDFKDNFLDVIEIDKI